MSEPIVIVTLEFPEGMVLGQLLLKDFKKEGETTRLLLPKFLTDFDRFTYCYNHAEKILYGKETEALANWRISAWAKGRALERQVLDLLLEDYIYHDGDYYPKDPKDCVNPPAGNRWRDIVLSTPGRN